MNWSKVVRTLTLVVPVAATMLAAIAGCQGAPSAPMAPQPVSLQPDKQYRVGVVSFGGGQREVILGLQEGMTALGYVEGKNIVYAIVDAAGSEDQVRVAAEEFLRQGMDAVYAASTPVTIQVAKVIKDIPVVFNIVSDPVGVGLANSLTSSGNNLTGCSNYVGQTGPKRLEVLKSILPNLKTVLVLHDPNNKFSQGAILTLRESAATLGVTLAEKHVGSKDDVVAVMNGITENEYDAFFHLGEAQVTGAAAQVIEAANTIRLPTIAHEESFARRGMLASYGPSWRTLGRQCAGSLDQVLRGTNPREIPIQIPLKFDFIVNVKTAKALGFELPQDVLARADELIEQ